jgi:hypothetical protein
MIADAYLAVVSSLGCVNCFRIGWAGFRAVDSCAWPVVPEEPVLFWSRCCLVLRRVLQLAAGNTVFAREIQPFGLFLPNSDSSVDTLGARLAPGQVSRRN